MCEPINGKETFLLTEYEFMQKCYELQFKHFMAVFYFWIAVITAPISASLLSNIGVEKSDKLLIYGITCLFIAFIGIFLSFKMFDIRRSELRYVQKLNEIRNYFTKAYDIENKDKLILLGKNSKGEILDFYKRAKRDFGRSMAFVMSLVHGILVLVGIIFLFLHFQPVEEISLRTIYIITSIIIGLFIFIFNFCSYFCMLSKNIDA